MPVQRGILVVEDDRSWRSCLVQILRGVGCGDVIEASTWEEATRAAETDWRAAVVDLHLPGRGPEDGLRLIAGLRARGRERRIVVVSGLRSSELTAAATDAGADLYLTKPVGSEAILKALGISVADQESPKQKVRFPTLEEHERDYVTKILEETGGNKSATAKILGISIRGLYHKLSRWS